MDTPLKEILAFVHYGSIVNNRPKISPQSKHTDQQTLEPPPSKNYW